MWYHVGSKDEKTAEKGIAHLIEHMVFKGTDEFTFQGQDITLSESDINLLGQRLSAGMNAFTSYDYTGYRFELPKHTWEQILPVFYGCMTHVAFKEEHLASEMKAVIQELKLYRDNYVRSLLETMLGTVFHDHPYHYPIIGYKQDLWNVHADDLKAFYKKHYSANNATFVVVGDVEPQKVFALAKKYFADLPSNPDYSKEEFFHSPDVAHTNTVIYRDVKQPTLVYGFAVPGTVAKQDHLTEVLEWIVAKGKASRLHAILVDEKQLAASVSAFTFGLFEHDIFFIVLEPTDIAHKEAIEQIIAEQMEGLAKEGPTEEEIMRALNKTKMDYYSLFEDTTSQAYHIGHIYLATQDETYPFELFNLEPEQARDQLKPYIARYFRPALMHQGSVLPVDPEDKPLLAEQQEESDKQDKRILDTHKRDSAIEPPLYALTVDPAEPAGYTFPKPAQQQLKNGLELLYYNNQNTPKIDLTLSLKAKSFYDPNDKLGIGRFVAALMTEGTSQLTASEFARKLETLGMSLSVSAGSVEMSMPSKYFSQGLGLLRSVLDDAVFEEEEVEKIRTQMLLALDAFWDEPKTFSGHLARRTVYGEHPYSKLSLGTRESLHAITQDELLNYYKQHISPEGATLSIVGDLEGIDVAQEVEKAFGSWKRTPIKNIVFPKIEQTEAELIIHPIERDQVVLGFACVSVDRFDPDYEKLMLFDEILGGNALSAMASRLFAIRERTGLFYTIRGSLIEGANEQPGMIWVRTIVSKDNLEKAEQEIKKTLETITNDITEQELVLAKNSWMTATINKFESNMGIAGIFQFLHRYNLPWDYLDKRAERFRAITLDEVKQAAQRVLACDNLSTIRIGRVTQEA